MEEPAVAGLSSVLARRHGRAGWITLNRPEVINALDLPMIRAITGYLRQWQDDPEIALVVLDGAGERGFCAGGDLRLPPAQPPDPAWLKLGADPGLCGRCRHAKLNETRRGTAYLRCTRATWDSRLPRYPRLPVGDCPGFQPR